MFWLFGCICRIRSVFISLLVLRAQTAACFLTSRLKGKLLPESVVKLQPAECFVTFLCFFLTRMKLNSAGVLVNIHRHRPVAWWKCLSEQRAAPHLHSAVSERCAGRDTIMTVLITHLRFKGIVGLFALWVCTVSRLVQPFGDSLRAWKTFVLLIRRLKESTWGRRALCLSAADRSITHDENTGRRKTRLQFDTNRNKETKLTDEEREKTVPVPAVCAAAAGDKLFIKRSRKVTHRGRALWEI